MSERNIRRFRRVCNLSDFGAKRLKTATLRRNTPKKFSGIAAAGHFKGIRQWPVSGGIPGNREPVHHRLGHAGSRDGV